MAIAINGSGTMTGISVGGLPDGIVDSGTLATNSVTSTELATNSVDSAELIDGAIDASHLASGVGGPTNIKFLVQGASASNVTGNGALYTHTYTTEHFDMDSDFDGTSTFTAPETGKYLFCVSLRYSGVTSVADGIDLQIVTSNRTYQSSRINVNGLSSQAWMFMSIITEMEASDTAIIKSVGTGESGNVWDLEGDKTFFSGALLA